MSFDPESVIPPGARIKVIGIGGGGGNAVNTMIRQQLEGVDFIAANTDVQVLRFSLAPTKIQVGRELTKGLGAGADPDIGRDAALEDRHAIQEAISGADMVFITAGMGGGTGTGGASVIAQIARDMGALTVGVVTKPFHFEGKRRRRQAELGVQRLRESVDTLITIPNQRLLQVASPELSMIDAFRMADNVLLNAVRGISDIINVPGTVNVDFADVKTVMSCMGLALMGIGTSSGEQRAIEAARQAISSPLLEDVDIEGATGILINITAGSNVTLMEINEACSIIQDAAHEDANIIFGAVIDEEIGEEIRVTVIATGFPSDADETDELPRSAHQGARRAHFESPAPYHRNSYPQASATRSPFASHRQPSVATPPEAVKPQASPAAIATAEPKPETPVVEPKNPITATDISEQSFSTVAESEDLARWTMGEISFETEAKSTVGEPSPAEQMPAVDLVKDTPAPLNFDGATASDEAKQEGFSGPASELSASDSAHQAEPRIEAPTDHQDDEPPLESLFSEMDDFNHEGVTTEKDRFDQKIDEALELAERLKDETNGDKTKADTNDDLDVPAFLRNGMKDFSLT